MAAAGFDADVSRCNETQIAPVAHQLDASLRGEPIEPGGQFRLRRVVVHHDHTSGRTVGIVEHGLNAAAGLCQASIRRDYHIDSDIVRRRRRFGIGRKIVRDGNRLFGQPTAAGAEPQMIEQRIGRCLRVLADVVGRVKARMRIAQFHCTHLQVVQQRELSRARHVRVVRKIPGAVEEAVRVAALGGAVVEKMMQRVVAGGDNVGIARPIPVGIEKAGQRVAEIGDGGRFRFLMGRRHASVPVQPIASGRCACDVPLCWRSRSASRRTPSMSRQTSFKHR